MSDRGTTITQDDINAYAAVSGDFNPIHVDPEFARTTAYGSTIAHGTISAALICRHIRETIGVEAVIKSMSLRFVGSIRSGDRLHCAVEPRTDAEGPGSDRAYAVASVNQDGVTVAVGDVVIGSVP